jgi:hypothetical protein
VIYSPDLGLLPLADLIREVVDDPVNVAAAGADVIRADPPLAQTPWETFEAWKTT